MPYQHDYREPFKPGQQIVIAQRRVTVTRIIATDNETMCIYVVLDDDSNEFVMKEIFSVQYFDHSGFKKHKGGPFELDAQLELSGHPSIVTCFGGQFYKPDPARYHILMEYASCGDLISVVKSCGPLGYSTSWSFYHQIVSAIGHMHRKDRCHCAVDPRNVFVFTENICKLGDFGNGGMLTSDYTEEHSPNGFSGFEAADLRGAAQCLMLMLLGKSYMKRKIVSRFMKVRTKDDIIHLFNKKPVFAKAMSQEDCWYIRQFFSPGLSSLESMPIPISYGPTRKPELNKKILETDPKSEHILTELEEDTALWGFHDTSRDSS